MSCQQLEASRRAPHPSRQGDSRHAERRNASKTACCKAPPLLHLQVVSVEAGHEGGGPAALQHLAQLRGKRQAQHDGVLW